MVKSHDKIFDITDNQNIFSFLLTLFYDQVIFQYYQYVDLLKILKYP